MPRLIRRRLPNKKLGPWLRSILQEDKHLLQAMARLEYRRKEGLARPLERRHWPAKVMVRRMSSGDVLTL